MSGTPCREKVRYQTRIDAQTALHAIRHQAQQRGHQRGETSYYRCPQCGFYHLTSTTRSTGQALGIALDALRRIRASPQAARMIASDALDQIGPTT